MIAVSYWTYSLIRNAVPEQKAEALRNADWIWRMEHHLGIAVEESVNHAVNSVTWLIIGMNYYYATLHFVVTLSVLVWLYRSHPGRYAATGPVLQRHPLRPVRGGRADRRLRRRGRPEPRRLRCGHCCSASPWARTGPAPLG